MKRGRPNHTGFESLEKSVVWRQKSCRVLEQGNHKTTVFGGAVSGSSVRDRLEEGTVPGKEAHSGFVNLKYEM